MKVVQRIRGGWWARRLFDRGDGQRVSVELAVVDEPKRPPSPPPIPPSVILSRPRPQSPK